MFEKLQLTAMAQAMSSYAGARMDLIAQNVAHADTPGFKALDLPSFSEIYREADTDALRRTRAGHLGGFEGDTPIRPEVSTGHGAAAPNGNSVSLEQEMVKAATVRQDHETALAIYRNTSDIIRASLGRK